MSWIGVCDAEQVQEDFPFSGNIEGKEIGIYLIDGEYFALEGISRLLNTIKIIKSKLNPSLEIEGFLLTMYDNRLRLANQVYAEVKKHFQEMVFDTIIARNVRLSEAPSYGKPVMVYDPESKGAINYQDLAKELIAKQKVKL